MEWRCNLVLKSSTKILSLIDAFLILEQNRIEVAPTAQHIC